MRSPTPTPITVDMYALGCVGMEGTPVVMEEVGVLEGRKPRFVVNVDGVAVGEVDEAVIVS
jgi:hypothetical protein